MRVVNKSNSKIVYMSVTKLFGYYRPEVGILYSLKIQNEKFTFPFIRIKKMKTNARIDENANSKQQRALTLYRKYTIDTEKN